MFSQGEQGGIISHIATSEDQRPLFLMKACQLRLQILMHQTIARDVPCPSSTSSEFLNGFTVKKKNTM